MRLSWIVIALLAYEIHRGPIVVVAPLAVPVVAPAVAPRPPAVAVRPSPTTFHLEPCTCNNPCGDCDGGDRWMLVNDVDGSIREIETVAPTGAGLLVRRP